MSMGEIIHMVIIQDYHRMKTGGKVPKYLSTMDVEILIKY